MNVENAKVDLSPIRKSVTVSRPVEEAFELFTAGLDRWWPRREYSVGQEEVRRVGLDPGVGGELYEVRLDGTRVTWGRVTVWEPPSLVRFTWHPGRGEDTEQLVEVRFSAEDERTRVDLVHSGWERLGKEGPEMRGQYDTGWDYVFGKRFLDAACGD